MMKRNALIIGVVLSLLAGACTPQATATVNPVDIQHTAEAAALTIVAQTQEAIPSSTSLPPTTAPSPTLFPTDIPPASPTLDAFGASPTGPAPLEIIPTFTSPANIPTFTPQSSASNQDSCNKPLTSWKVPTANLKLTNDTKPGGSVVTLSLYVVTEFGECGYLSQRFESGGGLSGPVGSYSAGAFVDGKKSFKVFGSFQVGVGTSTIIIRNDRIILQGGCYPNC